MKVFYSQRFLEHTQGPGHPESPERLKVIREKLPSCKMEEPHDIDEKELLIIHTKEYLEKLKALGAKGVSIPDNLFAPQTFGIAKLAAAAAKDAALTAVAQREFSFALVRPPGHHAGKESFGGLCYLNNIAFAVRSVQRQKKVGKVLIIDFDAHTGNGTWEIFYPDSTVYYLSFHQDPKTIFPGTGFESENTPHMQNVCFHPETGDAEYLERFEKILKEVAYRFEPELIAVSAGFDGYKDDPMADLALTGGAYRQIGKSIAELRKPTFAVLEGGYNLTALGDLVAAFLSNF